MLNTRFNNFSQVAPNPNLLLCVVKMCSWKRVGNTFLMVVSLREMARTLSYYLCFSPLSASPNGICLKLNNSSIKCQVRNKKLNTKPFKLASHAERWNFSCLRLKAHSSRWKSKRMRRARGKKMVDGREKNEEAQDQDRGGRQSKWQLHCK